jgi:hypothetical protein
VTTIRDIRRRLRPVSAQITTRMGRFAPAERAYRARSCELAKRYLRGGGLEIGALNCPLPMPPGASLSGEFLTERAAALERESYSIHFHVWTASEFADMLDHARKRRAIPVHDRGARGKRT